MYVDALFYPRHLLIGLLKYQTSPEINLSKLLNIIIILQEGLFGDKEQTFQREHNKVKNQILKEVDQLVSCKRG